MTRFGQQLTVYNLMDHVVSAGGDWRFFYFCGGQLDCVSSWWSAVGDWRLALALGTQHRFALGINQTTSADGCNVKQLCETIFGKV